MIPQPGEKAPDFTCIDQDGMQVSLKDYAGKKLILYFYPKDQTPGCTKEACNLRDNYRTLQQQGYEVLGVSTDSPSSHQKFIAKEKLPFRLLADVDKTVHQLYGTWVEKSMYGRKYMGTARVTFIINEKGIIEEVIDKVDTSNHAAQILKTPVSHAESKSTGKKKAAGSKKVSATKKSSAAAAKKVSKASKTKASKRS